MIVSIIIIILNYLKLLKISEKYFLNYYNINCEKIIFYHLMGDFVRTTIVTIISYLSVIRKNLSIWPFTRNIQNTSEKIFEKSTGGGGGEEGDERHISSSTAATKSRDA